MRRHVVGARSLIALLLATALLAGCSPNGPTTAPSTAAPSTAAPPTPPGPTASAATPSPSAATGLGIEWTSFLRLGDMRNMVHGAAGWVVLAGCPEEGCAQGATVWLSADMQAWDTIKLPASNDVVPIALSANSDGYLVAAYDYDKVGNRTDAFVQVWRSSDGRSWERVGERRLGPCNNRCPSARGVGLAPNGAIVVGAITGDEEQVGPHYVSDDGLTWRETRIAGFSQGNELDRIIVGGMESTPTDLFLFGWGCTGESCPLIVWSTTDGEHWVEEQSFATGGDLSIASDGIRRVVAVSRCDDCAAIWAGITSTGWTNVAPALDVTDADLVWTGDAFVLVGVREDRYVAYASPDGITWAEVSSEVLGGPGNCGRPWLAGGQGTVLFVRSDCAAWKGTLQQAR